MSSMHKDVSRRTVSVLRRGGTLAIAALLVSVLAATADEPSKTCSGKSCRKKCELSTVPLLSKLPYISRLFKNVGVDESGAEVERIGIDFDWIISTGACGDLHATCHEAAHCESAHCESAPAFVWTTSPSPYGELLAPLPPSAPPTPAGGSSECATASHTKASYGSFSCGTSTCNASACGTSACGKNACGASACCKSGARGYGGTQQVAKSSECACCSDCSCSCCGDGKVLGKHVVRSCTCTEPAVAENHKHHKQRAKLKAALVAKRHLETLLESQARFEESKQELLESLMESLVEKARLEAQLAVAHERQALLQTVSDVTAENVRLKTQLELVSQKEELLLELTRATRENQELKARVANLAERLQKHSPHKPQTAAEPRNETPRR